ncbi:MAG: hypothetical protein KF716_21260 [Anaerolineae bacterium]|nr:hypothetical protein [Anaerolineae bacterium]
MFIEITGRVDENGNVQIDWPTNLPVGQIRVVIEAIDAEAEVAEEAKWEASLAKSEDVLARMADKAHEDYLAGRTEEFDPDIEEP